MPLPVPVQTQSVLTLFPRCSSNSQKTKTPQSQVCLAWEPREQETRQAQLQPGDIPEGRRSGEGPHVLLTWGGRGSPHAVREGWEWNREEQIPLHSECFSYFNLCIPLCFHYKNAARSLGCTGQPILKAPTFRGITLFHSHRDKKLQNREYHLSCWRFTGKS